MEEKGSKRREIMNAFDVFVDDNNINGDVFKEELKSFIDEIGGWVGEIRNFLDVKGVDDLSNISEAYNLTDELSDSIY